MSSKTKDDRISSMTSIEQLRDEWGKGKAWIDHHTRDNVTLDTLADGAATSNQQGAPQVGIVTLANGVRQIPRNSVQDVPVLSAQVNGTKLSVDAIVASFLLRSVVFNEDTFGNGVLQTMQMAAQRAMTTGFVALRANVGKIFNQFSTMLETIHYNDLVIEPGVFDASNSSYYHVRTRVTKHALKGLLKAAKENPDTQWDVEELQNLYDAGPQPFDLNQYLPTTRQNAGFGMEENYDLITRYGVGAYYDVEVYSPQSTKPLMAFKSKSKFGYPRISLLTLDPAELSPFGISRAKLASPMANYGNIYLQSTAKMQLLNADAPVFKRGLFTTATPLRRGAIWESADPNADVRIMELSNSTLEQFNNVMSYIDSNIMSTLGVGSSNPSARSSAYQNKDAVQSEVKDKDLSSQQVTAIIENAIRQYALTALDLFISEQTGDTPLIVDDEAKDAINQLNPAAPGSPEYVGDDNVVMVNWEQYYDRIQTWTVKVDLSIRRDQLQDKERADLQDTFTVMKQTANPDDPVANATADALGAKLVQDAVPDVAKSTQMQQQSPQAQPFGGEQMPMGQ